MINSLVAIRKQQGISQRDLAKKLNKAHSYIGRIETFERRLDVVDLVSMARALDLSDKEILKIFEKLL
ncbi:MAG: helix-turn-helix transcriptional regulator [Alphaproteobacteria bacterium]|nr:helix-turn-helix transcriptional regulator [Alphaproteobacteria bacterium]